MSDEVAYIKSRVNWICEEVERVGAELKIKSNYLTKLSAELDQHQARLKDIAEKTGGLS